MKVSWPALKGFIDQKQIYPQIVEDEETIYLVYVEGTLVITCEIIKNLNRDYYEQFETTYRPLSNQPLKTSLASLPEAQPFSRPTYRTKVHGIANPIICPAGQSTVIDFILPEELYANGGEIITSGDTFFGDWVMAEIYDVNGIVPVPYRDPALGLAENYPSMSKYIVKSFVHPLSPGFGHVALETKPLVAKIGAGLSMRITYTATSSGGDRTVVCNYFLNKKLPGVSDI